MLGFELLPITDDVQKEVSSSKADFNTFPLHQRSQEHVCEYLEFLFTVKTRRRALSTFGPEGGPASIVHISRGQVPSGSHLILESDIEKGEDRNNSCRRLNSNTQNIVIFIRCFTSALHENCQFFLFAKRKRELHAMISVILGELERCCVEGKLERES
jgi:hypothetical protein